ncbi:ABC transporter substrate-binding protein [Amycolatopsis magusensis]|uniref:ABC-type glycerol-3-phosphate transport system substrate-binding protein n=1 Tax=Amycolatopsis magusensis TaxID=882444 RepID=A0ABS4PT60_9PSEU|nr:sugar ABC transporter substrate-binding protein [Amycolatopsis magusensis]MBP2182609.1 ABC-type glycerol-3-phosphate transport system substrate-binding protein [Amycolatopsis magusensis]MDI5982509.1 sugar ABC transporter substrate-binding protein [Amycolatopsis magusensis]
MKIRHAALAACLLGVVLTACGSGESGDSGPVKLTFQSLSDQPGAIEQTKKTVDEWNRTHPDTQVEIVQAGWDGVYDKLITQFNAGSAPDVIHYEAAGIVPFAKDGYVADLTPYLPEAKRADVTKGVLDSVTVDGQVIAYPTEVQSYVVFANKALLQQAGVTIPTGPTMTWDQLREIAKATTKDGKFGLGWGLSSPTASFVAMAPAFGGKYFEGTGDAMSVSIGEGEMALPQLVNAMAYEDKSILPVTLTQSGTKALAPFYGGQVAMTIQGSYQAANIAKDAPQGFDWAVLPPLAGPAGPAQASSAQTLSVNKDSAHVEQAAAFIDFFTSTENLAAINEADGLIPPTNSAREALAAKVGTKNGWDVILSSGQHLTSAPYVFADKYAQWKDTVATPAYQQFLAQKIDAAGLASQLRDGWQNISR